MIFGFRVTAQWFTICCAVAILASCNTTGTTQKAASVNVDPMRNISLVGTPNNAEVGRVGSRSERLVVAPGGSARLGGFRARECGETLDFTEFMKYETANGLTVPDGFKLSDGGVGWYKSNSCGGPTPARVVNLGVGTDVSPGTTVELAFVGGDVTKTIVVEEAVGLRAKKEN